MRFKQEGDTTGRRGWRADASVRRRVVHGWGEHSSLQMQQRMGRTGKTTPQGPGCARSSKAVADDTVTIGWNEHWSGCAQILLLSKRGPAP
jgi:hypothetical protein